MLDDLKNEMKEFLSDIDNNVKDSKENSFIKERTLKLFDVFENEINKIMNFKEDRINAIIKKQEEEEKIVNELKQRIENIYQDIYDEEDFSVTCPYCNNEFDADIGEDLSEIRCPECDNIIELDWDGNPNDESEDNCGGNCHIVEDVNKIKTLTIG